MITQTKPEPESTFVTTPLLPLAQSYLEHDPKAAAHCIETMSEHEALVVLKALPNHLAAEVFAHLESHIASALLGLLPSETFNEIVPKLDAHKAAGIIIGIEPEVRVKLIDRLPVKTRAEIRELLIYPEFSAGRFMSTDALSLRHDMKVSEAIQRIRNLAVKKTPYSYTYVIDGEDHLLGVVTMRDLILALPDTLIKDFMKTDVFTVNAFTDIEDVAAEMSKRKFFAAPVIDIEGKLIGIVKANQLIDRVQQGATEDLLKMFGAGSTEKTFSPVKYSIRKRLPWLHVNLLTAFMAAAVVAIFEDTIAQITMLAVFLPVVAGQGGNAGAQSLAVVMRGLVMREIPREKYWPLILKEAKVGVINGLVIGVVTGVVAYFWYHKFVFGIVIAMAMIVNLVAAGFAGAAIPIIMKALGFDPAQSSSIVLTTITDVVGFLAFLGFARMFLSFLI